jgi:hypothetical protein
LRDSSRKIVDDQTHVASYRWIDKREFEAEWTGAGSPRRLWRCERRAAISDASATVAGDVPQQILLQPASREYGLHREQYEAVATDLEGEGVLVRLLPVKGIPKKGADNTAEFYDLAIQVGAYAGTIVSNAKLVEIVRSRLRSREERDAEQRRAKIYLANGEQHEFIFGDEYE